MDNQINQRNSQGEPHGLWEDYYSNGKLEYRCNFQNGKLNGLWEQYYSNKQSYLKGFCKNNKRIGLWTIK